MARGRTANPDIVPKGPEVKRRCQLLGNHGEVVKRREAYKKAGMTPREAQVRAYKELGIGQLWLDYVQRERAAQLTASSVQLTPAETREVLPAYQPPSVTKGSDVGDEVMSPAESVQWAMHAVALVRNGGDPPGHFPCKEALFWFQAAVAKDGIWEKALMRYVVPAGEQEAGPVDGEAEFREAEAQIREALIEVGRQLGEYEQGFSETLNAVLSAGPEGACEQPAFSA